MDVHHVLAHRSTTSMTGLTAFSALPDAPVLADHPTRRQRLGAAWRARRAGSMQTPSLRRPVAVPAQQAGKAVPQPAEACRMVA
jgi:hypothetical protein